MHNVIRVLTKVSDRYAPSRNISFNTAHVFKALQLLQDNTRTGRETLARELGLGDGVVKTLVKHLKMNGIIGNSNAGMWLTDKGRNVYSRIQSTVVAETKIKKCSVALGKHNHAILIKGFAYGIRSGIEQRDMAIKMGALGATTLIFLDGMFLMPDRKSDSLRKEPELRKFLINNLNPSNDDVIIIGSAEDGRTAEMAAKYAALQTISDHEKHL